MSLLLRNGSDLLLVGSNQGTIFVVQKGQCNESSHGSSFELIRQVDLSRELGPNEALFNNMFDVDGNIWFTTGGFSGTATSTTLGFVTPDGLVRKKAIPGQIVENGIAVSGDKVFVVTGPPRQSQQEEDGLLAAYTSSSGNGTSLEHLWRLPYNAGRLLKPGTFARGSGTTPSLLGDDFVAVTDNDDEQLHLVIAHQKQRLGGEGKLVCKVSIFEPGTGAADVRPTVHFDGHSYRVVVLNSYQAPPMTFSSTPGFEINGGWNNRTGMTGGIASVEVSADGQGCSVAWISNLKAIMAPILSTSSGLFYTYVQEPELPSQGVYVCYIVALDWRSGKEIWRLKAGAGGVFNDNALAASIGPDGTFYQPVFGVTVTLKDG
ncbi:hypothetical protein CPLU01_11881 [Colletotrichum plurivorum]|uniref:Uncharacterized protein n=1 Tax=Colletotrichum plurivorum TaxID=2175906 RepID=A0A8H6K0P1_9PEZI|nr:hypothetical protein CPLU01_11881 [Colletotrichum plurivorum]